MPLHWKIHRGVAHDICNLRYKIPKEVLVVFHNGSTYDYHFIIKELAEEFEEQFECLGENTEKYITFLGPIKKKITKIDKDSNNKIVNISYKIKFIDSFRLMLGSLSSLVDNLAVDIPPKEKDKKPKNIFSKECEKCKNKSDYMGFEDNYMLLKCFHSNIESKKNNMDIINKFKNT